MATSRRRFSLLRTHGLAVYEPDLPSGAAFARRSQIASLRAAAQRRQEGVQHFRGKAGEAGCDGRQLRLSHF
jgi:hypothetical protein